VRPALKHANVTLRTHARVKRLEPDSSGRSVKRVASSAGAPEEAYSADIVVVSFVTTIGSTIHRNTAVG
jgi:predicted thioesterase